MNISFDKVKAKYIPDVLSMMSEFNKISKIKFDKNKCKQNLVQFINNNELGRFWLIRSNNEIAGYVALTFGFSFEYQGRDAFIDELFIKKEYRNKGIGKNTLNYIDKKAGEFELKALHLEVEKYNKKAKRLYAGHGFTSSKRRLLTKVI